MCVEFTGRRDTLMRKTVLSVLLIVDNLPLCSAYRSELFAYLKDFWVHVASTDQFYFSILPLLFHVKGCFQPGEVLSQSVFKLLDKPTLKRIAERYR